MPTDVAISLGSETVDAGTVSTPTEVIVAVNETIVAVSDPTSTVVVAENTTTLSVAAAETVAVEIPSVQVVAAGMQGPQGPQGVQGPVGPQGVQGPSGLAGGVYVYQQSTPTTTWTINHNLGFYPAIVVVDSSGTVVEGDVTYLNTNTAIVSFSVPFGGTAYAE